MGIPHRSFYAWTDERCDLLRKLHADGVSSSGIAAALGGGLTRNAVIGKSARLGLTKPGRAHNGTHSYRSANSKTTATPSRKLRIMSASKKGTLRLVEVGEPDGLNVRELPADSIPIEQRKTLMQLRSNDCRWPYGDPHSADFFFCGAPKEQESYCVMHAGIAFNPSRYRNVPDDEHARRSASSRRMMDRRDSKHDAKWNFSE